MGCGGNAQNVENVPLYNKKHCPYIVGKHNTRAVEQKSPYQSTSGWAKKRAAWSAISSADCLRPV